MFAHRPLVAACSDRMGRHRSLGLLRAHARGGAPSIVPEDQELEEAACDSASCLEKQWQDVARGWIRSLAQLPITASVRSAEVSSSDEPAPCDFHRDAPEREDRRMC